MLRSVLITALAIGCGACSSQESRDIEKVKGFVREKLRDPASAEFSNVRVVSGGIVCGEVNSKNGYGGYAGKQRFFGTASGEVPVFIADDTTPADTRDICQIYDQAAAAVAAKGTDQ